ncbi:2Fe-2S iron-sulfur cluster binding domain-containing protein [bacterium]|nr:2Fe-2S iron-sulfur cluster binding domain-containing protein [bacterium]
MPVFHKITIKEVRKESPDAVSVHFDIPDNIKEAYRYKPGQYLTLKLTLNGEELRRSYSLCTSPYVDDIPAIAVKRVESGRISNYVNDWFAAGQQFDVMTPMGNFTTELNEFYSRHFVLYAGGSGITPMMSILKSVLEVEPMSQVTLIYGNRDQESIIFNKELDELEGHFADRFKIIHCLNEAPANWQGETGLLTTEKVSGILDGIEADLKNAQHFICGPAQMMENAKQAILGKNVPAEKIHIEYFTSKADAGEAEAADSSIGVDDEPFTGKAKIEIELQGDVFNIEVKESDTILHAGLEAGIDPPFACQMGICTTCRAKMLAGAVHMDETEGLTQDELDQNYILTCQSHPKSNTIKIRYE